MPDEIAQALSEDQLQALIDEYDRDVANAALRAALPRLYAISKPYIDAISSTFYGATLPEDTDLGPRDVISVEDRERCLIALLASRRERLELAIHIYIALMERITPEEIANIILLAGVYTGVDNFSQGVHVEDATLVALADLVDAGGALDAVSVLTALSKTFA